MNIIQADRELETTITICNRKIKDIQNREGGTDLDYIHKLQSLIIVKEAAQNKLSGRS